MELRKSFTLLLFLLSACSSAPSESAIETAIAQTQIAAATNTPEPTHTPEPTSTQIPLSDIDLDSIFIIEGYLPTGYELGQIMDKESLITGNYESAINAAGRFLSHDNESSGNVQLHIMASPEEALRVFRVVTRMDVIKEGVKVRDPKDIGEKARTVSMYVPVNIITGKAIEYSSVTFVRCNALVWIYAKREQDLNGLITYAKKLDERLEAVVCGR